MLWGCMRDLWGRGWSAGLSLGLRRFLEGRRTCWYVWWLVSTILTVVVVVSLADNISGVSRIEARFGARQLLF